MKFLLPPILFGGIAFGLDLTFTSGANCTGRAEYGRRELPNISCYNLARYSSTQSVILAELAPGDHVRFFSDSDCQDELYHATSDACYTEPNSRLNSFQVQRNDKLESSVSTTDLVQYPVMLTNYTSLSQSSPYDINIDFSNIVSSLAYDLLIGATTIGTAVSGCILASGTSVPALSTCIFGAISLALIYVKRAVLAANGGGPSPTDLALDMVNGVIGSGRRKRDLIDNANLYYMSEITKRDGFIEYEHVGFDTRDMGDGTMQRSPVYEVEWAPGAKHYISAFLDEGSGSFVHRLREAAGSEFDTRFDDLGKRQDNPVRWNANGLEFSYCLFQGSTTGFDISDEDAYELFLDQLSCDIPDGSVDLTTITNFDATIYNEAATLVAAVEIVPYLDGQTKPTPPSCSNPASNLNEDCVVA